MIDWTLLPRDDASYSVVVKRGDFEYVSFGQMFNLTKRAAGQLTRSLAKVDTRYRKARVIKNTTARKAGILA